jgi:hypothetical protein
VHDSLTVAQVVDACRLTARHITVLGSQSSYLTTVAEYLSKNNISHNVTDDGSCVDHFVAVLVLELDNPAESLKGFLSLPPCVTVFDTVNYSEYFLQEDVNEFDYRLLTGSEFSVKTKNQATPPVLEHEFFAPRLERILPDIKNTKHKYHVIYAGATQEHRIDLIPFEQVIQRIRQLYSEGTTKFVFWNGDETINQPYLFPCQRICEYLADEMPENTFFYFTSGLDAGKIYKNVHSLEGFTYYMHMITGASFELVTLTNFDFKEGSDLKNLYDPYEIKTKAKKFLCFNRVPRPHRVELLSHMLDRDLVDQSFYSFDFASNCAELSDFAKKITEHHKHRFPLVLNRTPERENPVQIEFDDLKYYRNSYFSVICETIFYHTCTGSTRNMISSYDTVFLSEKIFKPFATKHPFIAVAFPGTLKVLQHLGYRTFSPWINEDYDQIEDDEKRLLCIVDEIQRLSSQTDQQWLEWQHGIRDTIEHNFNRLLEKKDLSYDKQALKYFDLGL